LEGGQHAVAQPAGLPRGLGGAEQFGGLDPLALRHLGARREVPRPGRTADAAGVDHGVRRAGVADPAAPGIRPRRRDEDVLPLE
ncbi:hypothetical protein DF186_21075, partial [Enterococcus hirae]